MSKLTGLFFGSFNPVHIGHLAIANYIVEFTQMDELWFVVSPQNPLKSAKGLAPAYHRLEMLRLALADYTRMKASDVEFSMPKPSYTIDTLTYLAEKYPERKFGLIMGSDNFVTFNKWKNYETILANYPVFVYPRKEVTANAENFTGNITITQAPLIEVSSSFIRNAIKEGRDVRFFLHDKVYEYITDCNLFR